MDQPAPGRSRSAASSADGRPEAEALAAEAVQWGGGDGDPGSDAEGAVSAEAQTAVTADAAVQCEPAADAAAALADPAERRRLLAAPELAAFLSGAAARCEEALQQNELVDVMADELAALVDEEGGEGAAAHASQAAGGTAGGGARRAAAGLVEHQSFSDLLHSKERVLSAVHWHPARRGVVAVACTQPLQTGGAGGVGSGSAAPAQAGNAAAGAAGATKGQQAGQLQAVLPAAASSTGGAQQPPAGCILVWNHGDAIHPEAVLQAPAEVLAFAFNPTQPQWLAAGLATGQVALFNLQQQQQQPAVAGSTASNAGGTGAAGAAAPAGQQQARPRAGALTKGTPGAAAAAAAEARGEDGRPAALLPAHVSLPEASHEAAVTDLHWMPGVTVSRDGRLEAAAGGDDCSKAGAASDACILFATAAADGSLLLWDMRVSTRQRKAAKDDEGPDWKPVLSLAAASFTKQPLPTTRFCLDGRGGPSAGRFLLGSLDGELAAVDAASYSLEHKGKEEWSHNTVQQVAGHTGRVVALGPSRFFPDHFLVVADSGFAVWRILDASAARRSSGGGAGGASGSAGSCEAGEAGASATGGSSGDVAACLPLFESPFAGALYTCGCWSPSKPGTILLGRADGRLEVWNLLERTHQAVLLAPVSPCALTTLAVSLQPPAGGSCAAGASAAQLLAVGDSSGTLHLLELPRALRRRGHAEADTMAALLQREQEQLVAVAQRTAQRLAEQRAAGRQPRAEVVAAQAAGARKQQPEEEVGRRSEEEGQGCDAAEQRYLQLEALWRQRLLGGGAPAVAADA